MTESFGLDDNGTPLPSSRPERRYVSKGVLEVLDQVTAASAIMQGAALVAYHDLDCKGDWHICFEVWLEPGPAPPKD